MENYEASWRYKVMDLNPKDLQAEVSQWSRDTVIGWLNWNDSNGIWTDEDSIAEGMQPMTVEEARNYMIKILVEDRVE